MNMCAGYINGPIFIGRTEFMNRVMSFYKS